MSKRAIRDFPLELPQNPWPLLRPTQEDRQYIPIPESSTAMRWRIWRESLDMFGLDIATATLKGALLGLFFFGIVYGVLSRLPFWLEGWHWAFAIGGLIVFAILTGLDLTVIIMTVVAFILSLSTIIAQPLVLLLFIGGGVVVRSIIELFPQKTP